MRNFIKKTSLILAIANLFSFAAYAELEMNSDYNIVGSSGIIVPIPGNENEDEKQDTPSDNNNNGSNNVGVGSSSGGGGSYRPSAKPTDGIESNQNDKTEIKQEPSQIDSNINNFSDIKIEDWFYEDVMFVFENRLMAGTSESEFSPYIALNRAMMITILHRIDGDNSVYEKGIFNDVEQNSWYENAVNWGFGNKIVSGTGENIFAPMDSLTREQLCAMLYNYTKYVGAEAEFADISDYSDNNEVSDWAKDAVSWAVQEKIITGKGNNTLAPGDSATRAETAAIIRRYIDKYAEASKK